jgi:hypothetical protein
LARTDEYGALKANISPVPGRSSSPLYASRPAQRDDSRNSASDEVNMNMDLNMNMNMNMNMILQTNLSTLNEHWLFEP